MAGEKKVVSAKPKQKVVKTKKVKSKTSRPAKTRVVVKSKASKKPAVSKKLKKKGKAKDKQDLSRTIPDKYEPGKIKVNLYDTKGKVVREIQLPRIFDTAFRPDLIRKDVKISQANRRQRYGPSAKAGMRHAVSQWGKGRGTARVQRLTQGQEAAESPPNVGGRRAHPPRPEHDFSLKMNVKERRKARYAAIASTAMPELVRARGHKFGKKITVPVIIEDDFAKIERTKKVISVLERLKVYGDVQRADDGTHIRAGKGTMRGRKFKKPKSLVIVVPEFLGLQFGAKNLPGVEIVTPENLNTEILAPGGDPGRLVIMTESAVKIIGAWENA